MIKSRKGPVALLMLSLAAELAYIIVKGSKEVASAEQKTEHNVGKSCQQRKNGKES